MIAHLVRYGYVPFMILALDGAAAAVGASRVSPVLVAGVVVLGIGVSLGAERVLPFQEAWNAPIEGDDSRDVVHAVVNELLMVTSVFVIPLLVAVIPWDSPWPSSVPFLGQLIIAILIADFGITTVHLVSHRVGWMWRLHAVHHSIRRSYGLNGLMKHPLHQTLETIGGVAPLLLLGMPVHVAASLAGCVAIQLLMQHSNVAYRVGPLRLVLALNECHRFHHLKWPGVGDVNFGLFTLLWDRLYGTFSYDLMRGFTSDDLGIAAQPYYPSDYVGQLLAPFRAGIGVPTVPVPAGAGE